MTTVGFWGVELTPGKVYVQEVDTDFVMTMAALSQEKSSEKSATVFLTYDDQKFALCTLTQGSCNQQPLNLSFTEGEEIALSVEGSRKVYLTGNYIINEGLMPGPDDEDDEDDFLDDEAEEASGDDEEGDDEIDEEALRQLIQSHREDEDDDEEDEDDEDEKMEVVENGKRKKNVSEKPADAKKTKVDNSSDGKKHEKNQKKEEKKAEKKDKKEEKKADKQKPAAESPQKETKVKQLPSGLTIEDTLPGSGKKAKKGAKVFVRYIGRLTNGKVFDQNTKGSPFSFKLAKGEVIKGWDIGIEGMQVGGTRKLKIPANLAYGARGAPPDIPPNATLEFEVKLLDVKDK
ncbi:peptidylprolyl isomerase fpr4 [Nowakowskiella sp. JEL0407]|nr:peptidylprolyl isomerase fpr4 [Nowakowskiella sp. JEL0407]